MGRCRIKKNTILIVDDERLNLNSLVELFQEEYIVLVAKNGQQALERAQVVPAPDLILLDIMMPEMDGFETCSRLIDNELSRDIPIIFITSLHAEEDQIRGFELGAVDFITKPFMPNVVKARVKTHLTLRSTKNLLEAQNAELLEAAKLREDVERIMRHDLKGPLSGIIGLPQLLLEDDPDEDCKRTLQLIERSGYKMLKMINNTMDIYKMETGSYVLLPEEVNVAKVVRKIWLESANLISALGLTLKMEIDGVPVAKKQPFIILGEKLLCYSMLSNLLKNAIEAAPENSEIFVSMSSGAESVIKIHNSNSVPKRDERAIF